VREVDRPGCSGLVRGRDAARERAPGPLVHRLRRLGALVEACALAGDQLADARAVDLGGCVNGDRRSPLRSPRQPNAAARRRSRASP
jgi:hypothetical protein